MTTALVLIDVQASLLGLAWDAEAILNRINGLAERASTAGAPRYLVRDRRVRPDCRLHPGLQVREGDVHIEKEHCDAFFGTPLLEGLARSGVDRLVVAGLQTEYCVDTTCRRAISEGFDVVLAGDAHTTLDGPALAASRIIAHHNRVLASLTAGDRRIRVMAAREIEFG